MFRETLEYDAGDDPYEQVLGKVTVDDDGNEVITDNKVLTWNPETNKTDFTEERDSGNTFLYREQTLTNRITGTRTAQVTKDWDAAALQAEFGDVKTEFTLQVRVKAAGWGARG